MMHDTVLQVGCGPVSTGESGLCIPQSTATGEVKVVGAECGFDLEEGQLRDLNFFIKAEYQFTAIQHKFIIDTHSNKEQKCTKAIKISNMCLYFLHS